MTGTLTHPAGTAAAPSIQFTGSTNTGFQLQLQIHLSFDTNAVERMNISATGGLLLTHSVLQGLCITAAAGLLSSITYCQC